MPKRTMQTIGGDVVNGIIRKIRGVAPSSFFLTLVDDADAAAVRETLGINQNSFKAAVRVATTAAGTLASDFESGDTVDGVTLSTGDRILIKDQAAGAENGIYVVVGSGAPTRATDMDSSAETLSGTIIPVQEGTANADKLFMLTTNAPITLGATSLTFSAYGTSGAPTGSAGGDLSGTYPNPTVAKIDGTTPTAFFKTLVDDTDASTARTTLGVVIGTDVQAYNADLGAIAALSPSNDDVIQRKAGNWTNRTMAQLWTDLAAAARTFADVVTFDKAKRIKVVTLTDAATVAVDASLGDAFFLSTANSRAFGVPTNAPAAGYTQIITITVYNSSGGTITPTLTTSGAGCYRYGTTVTAFPTIAAGKSAHVTLKWHAADSKWDVVGYANDF